MAISKSSYPIRLNRCQAIFDAAKKKAANLNIFFRDITKLTGKELFLWLHKWSNAWSVAVRNFNSILDRLLDLTNKTVEKGIHHLSLSENFRFLKRLLDDPNFSEIMLPGQSAMTVTLPADSDIGKLERTSWATAIAVKVKKGTINAKWRIEN